MPITGDAAENCDNGDRPATRSATHALTSRSTHALARRATRRGLGNVPARTALSPIQYLVRILKDAGLDRLMFAGLWHT